MIQLLEQIAKDQYETKAFADNHVKVQLKTSVCYGIIVKALEERYIEFHTYTLKGETSYGVILRNMHYSINLYDIKIEIQKLEHMVTNVWNIKQYRTNLTLSMFFVDLKPATNNEDIFSVEYIQQRKIKFKPSKHNKDISQCANCQRYGNNTNDCHLKLDASSAQVTI
jgi:hypothetical protein